jgi:hypothetical protein
MAGCCGAPGGSGKVTVKFPDGKVKTFGTRPEALAAITRAGGGSMRSA